MLEPLLSGCGFGFMLAFMVGPVFFVLIQTSVVEGFRHAASFAVGVAFSDFIWILIAYLFAGLISLADQNKLIISGLGGSVFIAFGIFNLIRTPNLSQSKNNKQAVHARYFLRGFLLNSVNPAVPVFWLGIMGIVKIKEHYQLSHEITFFASLLATVVSTDLLKAMIAGKLKVFLNDRVLILINRILGFVLIVLGVTMIVKGYR